MLFFKTAAGIFLPIALFIGSLVTAYRRSPVVIEMRSKVPCRHMLALLFSGAGGWIAFDHKLATRLADSGMDVIGINSQKYFLWHQRTPEETALYVASRLQHYTRMWQDDRILLLGYSQGADVMPFIARRLPQELKQRVTGVVLLGPAHDADFKIRIQDIIFGTYSRLTWPLEPELRQLGEQQPIICIYGRRDKGTICRDLHNPNMHIHALAGGHIFRNNDREVAAIVLKEIDEILSVPDRKRR